MLRAETISRTETGNAIHSAKHEAFHQALDKSGHSEQDVIRTWRHSGKKNGRDNHIAMDGQTVRGLTEPFVSPSGARLMHPCDMSLGAGASEVVNCACDEIIRLDPFQGRA